MLKALAREEKKTQALLLARAESQKRVRIPKVDTDANPFAQTRQYNDLVEQMRVNRNPAIARRHVVSRFHSCPLFSEQYSSDRPQEWDAIDETAVSGAGAERLVRTLAHAAPTRSVAGQSVRNKAYYLIDPKSGRPMVEQNRVRKLHVPKNKPPSFGHRPSSASRHLDPLRMAVRHEHAPPETRHVGMSPVDLAELLHDEATLTCDVKPPSPKDHVMRVDDDLYTTSPAPPPDSGGVELKPEASLANLKDDIATAFNAGGLKVDQKLRRRKLRDGRRRKRNAELEKNWDLRTNVGGFNKHKGVKHEPPSESLREQFEKSRKAAAGAHAFPFCEDRHELDLELALPQNKYLMDAGSGRLPAGLEETRRSLASKKPLTPRSERQNREIERIQQARKARDKRNARRVARAETRKLWDSIPRVPEVSLPVSSLA